MRDRKDEIIGRNYGQIHRAYRCQARKYHVTEPKGSGDWTERGFLMSYVRMQGEVSITESHRTASGET